MIKHQKELKTEIFNTYYPSKSMIRIETSGTEQINLTSSTQKQYERSMELNYAGFTIKMGL